MDQNVRLLHWLWMNLWNMRDYILMVIYRCGWMQKIHLNYRQFKQKFISDFWLEKWTRCKQGKRLVNTDIFYIIKVAGEKSLPLFFLVGPFIIHLLILFLWTSILLRHHVCFRILFARKMADLKPPSSFLSFLFRKAHYNFKNIII